jgi:4a-hydroxytetrahydrobiopterin dehydratase
MPRLTPPEIEARLLTVPRWSRQGDAIVRTFPFPDFVAAMAFVNRVAELAERAWHHPDIDIRWRTVTLSVTTHDEGGLTERDFSLAAAIDALQPRPEESA